MADLILAIDQGTTGTTVFVIDARGKIRGRAYGEIRQFYPKPGWVEHDPEEIYRSAVSLAKKALKAARAQATDVAAIGITNQRETFVVWERRSGRPVHRAIVWQCRRSVDICRRAAPITKRRLSARTGLLLDPYFSGTKLKWLLDAKPELRKRAARGELCFGTIDTWLIFKLSGGAAFVTDYTNASRTMLFNLEHHTWDEEMLRMLDVPAEMLPARSVRAARSPRPRPAPSGTARWRLARRSAISNRRCLGSARCEPGDSKSTYGTGAFLLMHTATSASPRATGC